MILSRITNAFRNQQWLTVTVEILPLLRLQAVNLRTHISLFAFANQDLMNSLHAIAEQAQ